MRKVAILTLILLLLVGMLPIGLETASGDGEDEVLASISDEYTDITTDEWVYIPIDSNTVLALDRTLVTTLDLDVEALSQSLMADESIVYGDANLSGKVDSEDAAAVLRHCVNIIQLTETQQKNADVTFDGDVTSADAARILRYVVALENDLSVPPTYVSEPTPTPDPDSEPGYIGGNWAYPPETWTTKYTTLSWGSAILGAINAMKEEENANGANYPMASWNDGLAKGAQSWADTIAREGSARHGGGASFESVAMASYSSGGSAGRVAANHVWGLVTDCTQIGAGATMVEIFYPDGTYVNCPNKLVYVVVRGNR